MKRALFAALVVMGCNEPLEGPQPDQKIQPKQIEGPPPSHRPNVNPEKAIAPAPVLAEPPADPKPAEPAPEAEPEKKAPVKTPVKKTKAKTRQG